MIMCFRHSHVRYVPKTPKLRNLLSCVDWCCFAQGSQCGQDHRRLWCVAWRLQGWHLPTRGNEMLPQPKWLPHLPVHRSAFGLLRPSVLRNDRLTCPSAITFMDAKEIKLTSGNAYWRFTFFTLILLFPLPLFSATPSTTSSCLSFTAYRVPLPAFKAGPHKRVSADTATGTPLGRNCRGTNKGNIEVNACWRNLLTDQWKLNYARAQQTQPQLAELANSKKAEGNAFKSN